MNKTMLKEPSSGASSRVEGVKVGFILCVCFLDSRVSLVALSKAYSHCFVFNFMGDKHRTQQKMLINYELREASLFLVIFLAHKTPLSTPFVHMAESFSRHLASTHASA